MGSGMELIYVFYLAFCTQKSPVNRELWSLVSLTVPVFTVTVTDRLCFGQGGYFKILAPLTQKPVLFSEDDAADDNPESQEMLEEQLVRLLTREVMDLISK